MTKRNQDQASACWMGNRGAIGSRWHKVDASYLSPHVNIAARLEAATKQYGVSMLIMKTFTIVGGPEASKQVQATGSCHFKGFSGINELVHVLIEMAIKVIFQ